MSYTVTKTSSTTGYFEHVSGSDSKCGMLKFDLLNNLIDYDGCYSLPADVIQILRNMGIIVHPNFE